LQCLATHRASRRAFGTFPVGVFYGGRHRRGRLSRYQSNEVRPLLASRLED
jgi:hypothetical protein